MGQKKVCPIIASAGVIAQGASQGKARLQEGWPDCVGSACAWFDVAADRCAVLTMARGTR